MATMAKDKFDSNIYENTDFMPKSGTNAPKTKEVNTIYEPLRMKDGKLNQVNPRATMKGKCVKRRLWIAGAVVTVLLCTGLSLLTGWVAGTPRSSNKPNGIKDITDNQEITQLPDTLQAQVENIIQLRFEEMQRALEEKITNQPRLTKLEKEMTATETRCSNIENNIDEAKELTENRFRKIETPLNDLEKEMTAIQTQQSAMETNFDEAKVKMGNRLTEIESYQHMKTAAFSVYPSASLLELDSGDVVTFDSVITDSMNGFNMDEHHYTCPISGTYYFSLCINLGLLGGTYDTSSEIDLEVGGSRILEVYSLSNDNDHKNLDQGCNAVICKCSAGSRVLGKCSSGCRILGSDGDPQSILSGFLIYPE